MEGSWCIGGRGDWAGDEDATITPATGDVDPLESCVAAFPPAYITDPWVVLIRIGGWLGGSVPSRGSAVDQVVGPVPRAA